jgi:hypothetical protein
MLRALNNKTVQGDRFGVFVPDIHTVIYSEDGRDARVEIEGGMSGDTVDWLIYSETLSGWNIQGGIDPMTDNEKKTVLRRISESLLLLNMPHRLA